MVYEYSGMGRVKVTLSGEDSPSYGFVRGKMGDMFIVAVDKVLYNGGQLLEFKESEVEESDEDPAKLELVREAMMCGKNPIQLEKEREEEREWQRERDLLLDIHR